MEYVALICARGGSKGLPKKNTKLLNGKPLITWSINLAKKIDRISRIIVSTDNQEIADIAISSGAEVPFIRPSHLAEASSDEWKVWQHAVEFMKNNNFTQSNLISLPPTSPLRTIQDISKCLDEFEKQKFEAIITVADSYRNPYFNMVRLEKNKNIKILIESDKKIIRRQDAPKVYDVLTVAYVTSFDYIINKNNIFEGKVGAVRIKKENAIDIDTALEFEIAEFLKNKNNYL